MSAVTLVLLWALLAPPSWAATYYVANDGDDGADGTSEGTPWRTIEQVNDSSFSCGDLILFKRGDLWRELLVPPSGCTTDGQAITFSDYGDVRDALPKITGADPVVGWSREGTTNVWAAPIGPVQVNILTVNDELAYWRDDVASLSAQRPHEWTWSSSTLYLYSETNPTGDRVEAGQRRAAVEVRAHRENVILEDLDLSHGNSMDLVQTIPSQLNGIVQIKGATGPVTVRRCRLSIGQDLSNHHTGFDHWRRLTNGVTARDGVGDPVITIEGNYIDRAGHGVVCGQESVCVVRRNTIVDGADDCIWTAPDTRGDEPVHTIESNVCIRSADDGIQADQSSVIVRNRIIEPSGVGILLVESGKRYQVFNNAIYRPNRATGQVQSNGVAVSASFNSIQDVEMDCNLIDKPIPDTFVSDDFEGCAVDGYWSGSTGTAVSSHPHSGSCSYATGDGFLSVAPVPRDVQRLHAVDFWVRLDSGSSLAPDSAEILYRIEFDDASVVAVWLATDSTGQPYLGMTNGDGAPALDYAIGTDVYHFVQVRKNGFAGTPDSRIWLHVDNDRRKVLAIPGAPEITKLELGEVSGDRAEFIVNIDDAMSYKLLPDKFWYGYLVYGSIKTTDAWQALGRDRHGLIPDLPLVVDRLSSGDLRLEWCASCTAPGTDFAIYEGMLGDYESHEPKTCSTGGDTSAIIEPGSGSRYYLVVPSTAEGEGSYGFDGEGEPRAPSGGACAPQIAGECAISR